MFDTVSSLAYGCAVATLSRRPEPTSAKRAQIEARVLEATEALLSEGASYTDLSIERIATRAGISRTAFYFYFRDRSELLMRLTEDVAELLYAEGDAWWSGEGDGPAELDSALRKVIALYREHGVRLRAVVEAAAVDEAVAGFWRALVGRFVEASRRRIEAEQAAGRMGPMPAEEVAFSLSWMTERACYQRLVQGADLADAAFTAGLVRIWTGALYGGA
jgi:TetR/AcrR family transcriptional regulator, ethionamide resistance regulator